MTYASTNDMEMAVGGAARLVELADWDGDGVADADVLERAKAAADAMLDSHLRLRTSAADLIALRAAPPAELSTLAAEEAVYWMKKSKGMIGPDDIDLRKERERHLDLMRAGQLRPADNPTPQRAVFIENDDPVSRKGLKGQW